MSRDQMRGNKGRAAAGPGEVLGGQRGPCGHSNRGVGTATEVCGLGGGEIESVLVPDEETSDFSRRSRKSS